MDMFEEKGVTAETKLKAVKLYASGQNMHRVAKNLGISVATVRRAVMRAVASSVLIYEDDNRPKKRKGRTRLNESAKREIIEFIELGYSLRDVAEVYDCSHMTVGRIFKEDKIKRNQNTKTDEQMENIDELDIIPIPKEGMLRGHISNFDFRVIPTKANNFRFTLSSVFMEKLGLIDGDQIVVGHVGHRYYVAKRNIHSQGIAGYTPKQDKSSKSTPYYFYDKILHKKMVHGSYILGDHIVKKGIMWFELVYEKEMEYLQALKAQRLENS